MAERTGIRLLTGDTRVRLLLGAFSDRLEGYAPVAQLDDARVSEALPFTGMQVRILPGALRGIGDCRFVIGGWQS